MRSARTTAPHRPDEDRLQWPEGRFSLSRRLSAGAHSGVAHRRAWARAGTPRSVRRRTDRSPGKPQSLPRPRLASLASDLARDLVASPKESIWTGTSFKVTGSKPRARPRSNGAGSPTMTSTSSRAVAASSSARSRSATAWPGTKPKSSSPSGSARPPVRGSSGTKTAP